MKRGVLIAFVVACLAVCLLPAIGMLFRPTTQPIGNEQATPAPSLVNEDGSLNANILSDMGTFFEKHFGFRPEVITADALIQGKIFGVSNLDSVVVGKDGWLYYASTLDDYMGRNVLTQQQAQGIVHNLSLVQGRVEERGGKFLFAVAPNKNTLYPEYMPDYYHADDSAVRTRDLLNQALATSDVDYCNLFNVLGPQDEVLYFARDSHWNNKGALLAYDAMLDKLGKSHSDYSATEVSRAKDFVGDLSKMIYPSAPDPEYNYNYGAEDSYSYVTDTSSVEDPLIQTKNDDAQGTLFMYRDSFGNLLVPFFASAFGDAVFSKSFPIMLDVSLSKYRPNDVIFEIAERNISWFLTQPPIMQAPIVEASMYGQFPPSDKAVDVVVKTSDNSPMYLEVSGTLDISAMDEAPQIYIYISDVTGKSTMYECYNCLTENGDDGFLAYLNSSDCEGQSELSVSVAIKDGAGFKTVGSSRVTIERSYEY